MDEAVEFAGHRQLFIDDHVVEETRGVELQGYRKIDCAVFDGSSVRHRVTWRDSISLDAL